MSFSDFQKLDVADLIINIWSYNENKEHLAKCSICKSYSNLSIRALAEKWQKSYGDFHHFVDKLKKTDKSYINIGKYSSATKHEIVILLRQLQPKKLIFIVFVVCNVSKEKFNLNSLFLILDPRKKSYASSKTFSNKENRASRIL